ncbi:MAG TPA: GNAT family N-acetyltransferase [Mucilaginibacter sp.]|jgi:GNAT superfamily N-acetyltransferase|nr:GNAT family N-acetyltransferase [Mucilaginibacter sp.]
MLAEQVIIRDAVEDDIEELTALMTDLGYPATVEEFRTRFENISAHPDYRTIVAMLGNEMVGMAGLSKNIFYEMNGNYMRILAFVVKKSCRKLGIGKILIEASEDWAREQGLHTVVISSGNRTERDAAHAFYKKMGYAIKSSGFVKKL